MRYVRLSLVTAKPGHERRAADLLRRLSDFHREQPGYLAGYLLAPGDGFPDIGRLAIWRDERAASAAATQQHDLALRSELNLVIDPASHRESAFAAQPATQPAAEPEAGLAAAASGLAEVEA